jgi:hypothetical protein
MSDLRSKAEAAKAAPAAAAAESVAAVGRVVGVTPPAPREIDLANSGIPADLDVPVHVAWSRVMGEVQWIAKANRTTSGSQYSYRGVDLVLDAVAPALRKHGVIVMPVKVAPEYTVINTTKGSAMNYCRVVAAFAIVGPRGDVLSAPNDAGVLVPLLGEAIGEGFDTGDKSSMKAQSVALREFYIKALAIPVSRPAADPEHGVQHEIAGPKAPTADEYASMIIDERVTLPRLQQIKAELTADRAMGAATVEVFGGEPARLIDLVQRVGRTKMKETQG